MPTHKHHYLSIADIQVPEDRQRSAMERGPLESLAQSIETKGLLHPLVVTTADDTTLIAGARRLAAICQLYASDSGPLYHGSEKMPQGTVPVVEYRALSKLERYELEFEENHRREPLTWQDQCKALATLNALMQDENPKVSRTEVAEAAAPILAKTTKSTRDTLSQATIVNDYLDVPEVRGAKSLSKAYGVVSALVEREFATAAAGRIDAPSRHRFIHGDCREHMPYLDVLPNVIICDPPYGIGADSWSSGWAHKHHYNDEAEAAKSLMLSIIGDAYKYSAKDAHLYIFCDLFHTKYIFDCMNEWGWEPYNQPIIWHKGPQGYPAQVHHGLRRTYECIMYAIKGNARSRRIADDVIYCPATVPNKQHAAQKPVKLYRDLMSRHVSPGDIILDPCCGAGTVFAAAAQLFAIGIGIEQSDTMAAVAEQARRTAETTPAIAALPLDSDPNGEPQGLTDEDI